eukprot:scaffold171656_cov22-Tisochrysis_lutea.AAC.3
MRNSGKVQHIHPCTRINACAGSADPKHDGSSRLVESQGRRPLAIFNFAKRPAAICAAIGRCEAEDECNIVSQDDSNDVNDTPQPMDF